MSDDKLPSPTPEVQPEEKRGDCLTPSATMFVFLIMVLVQVTKWVMS